MELHSNGPGRRGRVEGPDYNMSRIPPTLNYSSLQLRIYLYPGKRMALLAASISAS